MSDGPESAETGRTLLTAAILLLAMEIALGVAGGAVVWKERKLAAAREAEWNLVPVVVVTETVSPGTTLTYDLISQRPIPEQFVTASMVKPDSANAVIGMRVGAPLHDGDPLRWSDLTAFRDPDLCQRAERLPARLPVAAVPLWNEARGHPEPGAIRGNPHTDIEADELDDLGERACNRIGERIGGFWKVPHHRDGPEEDDEQLDVLQAGLDVGDEAASRPPVREPLRE